MDEMMSVLRKIQNDLNEQKTAILENGNIVTQQVTQNINTILEEKFKTWEEKFNNISEKIENQEKRLFFLEKQARQRNIVLFGFEETETSYSNLESNIVNFVAQYFSMHMDRRDIQEIKRLGKKGEKPRPTIIMFSTLGLKIDIFQNRGKLKGTHYYIKEDYPKNILEKRKLLQNQVRMEREKGNKAIIKYDKIVILNNNICTPENKKRTLSISPEHNKNHGAEQKLQACKKNKTQRPIQRSSSLSESVLKPGILNFVTNKKPNAASNNQQNKSTYK